MRRLHGVLLREHRKPTGRWSRRANRGEGGIRTPGAPGAQRFSRPPHSATLSPLHARRNTSGPGSTLPPCRAWCGRVETGGRWGRYPFFRGDYRQRGAVAGGMGGAVSILAPGCAVSACGGGTAALLRHCGPRPARVGRICAAPVVRARIRPPCARPPCARLHCMRIWC